MTVAANAQSEATRGTAEKIGRKIVISETIVSFETATMRSHFFVINCLSLACIKLELCDMCFRVDALVSDEQVYILFL